MSAAIAPAKTASALCLVDSHPAEHDCRRVRVDFSVNVVIGTLTFPMHAVEMCGAGITLAGDAPFSKGDKIQLRLSVPGTGKDFLGYGIVTSTGTSQISCEYWANNSYEQQFLDEFAQACARRQELRKNCACHHA